MQVKTVVADFLIELADKIRNDSLVLDTEEGLALLSQVAHIKLSKQEVAQRLNISERTVDRKELSGEIPPSYRQSASKKVWFLDDIIKHKKLFTLV